MKSMTGFAKKQCNIGTQIVTIELKTLNSKQIDATVKIPVRYRSKELALRGMLNRLERGKMELIISEECSAGCNMSTIDTELVRSRYSDIKQLSESLGICGEEGRLLSVVLQQSDVWNSSTVEEISDEEWRVVENAVGTAIEELDSTRLHEGAILEKDFVKHIDLIEKYLGEIPQYEEERISTVKERLNSYFSEAAIKEVDGNRFEQELIYYLEKLDITEEKVRLAKHIDYFREVMRNEEGCGKKLSFIAQEMGREINTTGSKANHVEIQRLVVKMKDELEKIKEQLGNIL